MMRTFEIDVDSKLRMASARLSDPSDYSNKDRGYLPARNGFICNPTNRRITELATSHGFSPDEFANLLENKTVLDIGGGESRLGESLASLGIVSTVVNLDMASTFSHPDEEWAMFPKKLKNNDHEHGTIGYAEQMPYGSETIDVALASYSVPFYSHTGDEFESVINETLRVLKVGGFASFMPFIGGAGYLYDNSAAARVRHYGMVRTMSNMPELDLEYHKHIDALKIHKLAPII